MWRRGEKAKGTRGRLVTNNAAINYFFRRPLRPLRPPMLSRFARFCQL
jgi:hypothetical protein